MKLTNPRGNLYDLELGKDFLHMTQKVLSIRAKEFIYWSSAIFLNVAL